MRRLLQGFLATRVVALTLVLTCCSFVMGGEVWTLPSDPPSWARDQNALNVEIVENDSREIKTALHVVHNGALDWAVRIPERIDVSPGDVFVVRYRGKNVGEKAVRPSVVLYDNKNEAISWVYGGQNELPFGDWHASETKFIIPAEVATIEPRIVGDGKTDVFIELFQIERVDSIPIGKVTGSFVVKNQFLQIDFNLENASFSVLDLRTNRKWSQIVSTRNQFVIDAKKLPNGVDFELLDARNMLTFHAVLKLEDAAPELVVQLKADKNAPHPEPLFYPYPFSSRTTDRIILPINEGISFPATDNPPSVASIHTFGGHGLCMAFWGVVNDTIDANEGDGYMGIIETPDDSVILVESRPADSQDLSTENADVKALSITQVWHGAKKLFSYDRTLRLVFFDKGGHVAFCKRYRKYADKIGLLVDFDEKIRRNPNLAEGIDLLVGAANIWTWDADKLEKIHKLQEMGFDRILWSGGGSAEEIKEMNELKGVLTSTYDIYQDIMDPARYPEVSWIHGSWIPEAWPQDIVWDSPDGTWTKGWEVDAKDPSKPRIPCGVLCDLKAPSYAKKRIAALLKTTPYRCQFIDTTVASQWRECWNPDHPMTRTESKNARMELLALFGRRFNLVCGSETGIDASVPYCDYYEGMMSLGPYRCPDSGRYMDRIWQEVPELVEKYQLGETFRLPLFELVYHGCVVSYWYWGDYNNKFPALWLKRDLFNALYGVPPMYLFKGEFLDENRERFIESYKIAEPVSRLTGRVEMTDHQILTQDRKVQKTMFANGISVVVNFSDVDYRYEEEDVVVPAFSSKIFGANQ